MLKYFIIFAMLFVSQFAQAQTPTPSICNPVQAYFQKHDGTGTLPFDTDKTTKLNNAAIKLVQTIPDALISKSMITALRQSINTRKAAMPKTSRS
jgi:hypothetical protein